MMMKKIIQITFIALFSLGGFSSLKAADNKTEKFKVYGNCGMCKARIEKAAKSVDGVSKAEWDKVSKIIEVTFDSTKTDVHKIHMAIAKVGHDTEMHKAKKEVYEKLPECCKYERAKKE
jgi:periplasmic mercuric ion binding protein